MDCAPGTGGPGVTIVWFSFFLFDTSFPFFRLQTSWRDGNFRVLHGFLGSSSIKKSGNGIKLRDGRERSARSCSV